ncbi:MAG TPA: hypothetical protein VF747_00675 [Blastocatellia bacterium]|jgi:hypothetical protein
MDQESNDVIIIRRYLLGELSQEEQESLERRLMTDGDCFRLASALEEELVDKYISDDLPKEERERFGRRFLATPEGAEELKLAANLRRYARGNRTSLSSRSAGAGTKAHAPGWLHLLGSRFSAAQLALVATLAVFTVMIIALTFKISGYQERVERLEAMQESPTLREQELQNKIAEQQASNDELAKALRREQEERARLEQEVISLSGPKPDNPQSLVAAITLSPVRTRGAGQSNSLVIKPGVSQVLLRLLVREPAHESYRASLQNESGDEIWASGNLRPQTEGGRIAIRVSVSARLLPGGDYTLRLLGRTDKGDYEETGNYYFRVAKG